MSGGKYPRKGIVLEIFFGRGVGWLILTEKCRGTFEMGIVWGGCPGPHAVLQVYRPMCNGCNLGHLVEHTHTETDRQSDRQTDT